MATNPEEMLSDVIDDFIGPDEEDVLDTPPQDDDGEPDDVDLEDAVDDAEAGADDDPADEDGDVPAAEAKPMPGSWSKEDAKAWGELPPAAQDVVLRREEERDKFLRSKAHEASQTRQQTENEAREIIAQINENHARALQVYASQFQAHAPDERLLYSNDPNDVLTYHRQDAAYRANAAQQYQLQQQIEQAQGIAGTARSQAQQADFASDAQRLREQLPEWFEPSTAPALQASLQGIGKELGYPDELMNAASSTDILALKKAADWKADAEKYRKLVAKKMEGVRAAKGVPKMAAPGVKPAKAQANAASANSAWERVKSGKDPSAAADWLEKAGFM